MNEEPFLFLSRIQQANQSRTRKNKAEADRSSTTEIYIAFQPQLHSGLLRTECSKDSQSEQTPLSPSS